MWLFFALILLGVPNFCNRGLVSGNNFGSISAIITSNISSAPFFLVLQLYTHTHTHTHSSQGFFFFSFCLCFNFVLIDLSSSLVVLCLTVGKSMSLVKAFFNCVLISNIYFRNFYNSADITHLILHAIC